MTASLQVVGVNLVTNARAAKQLLSAQSELASFLALKRSSLPMPRTFAAGPGRGVNLQVSIRSGSESGCGSGISQCLLVLLELLVLIQMLEMRVVMDMGILVRVVTVTAIGLLADIELIALGDSAWVLYRQLTFREPQRVGLMVQLG